MIIIIITWPTEVAVTLSFGGNQVAEMASGPELMTMLETPLRMLWTLGVYYYILYSSWPLIRQIWTNHKLGGIDI